MRSNVVNINETKVISVFFFFFLSNGLFEGVCTDELRDYEGSPSGTEFRAGLRSLVVDGRKPMSMRYADTSDFSTPPSFYPVFRFNCRLYVSHFFARSGFFREFIYLLGKYRQKSTKARRMSKICI